MTFEKKEFDFKKHGAFFAFGDEQLNKGIAKGKTKDDYVAGPMGMILLKENAKKVIEMFVNHNDIEDKRRLKEIGKNGIIKYELSNHEAYYTYDLQDTFDAIEHYGITMEEIRNVFNKEKHLNDCF